MKYISYVRYALMGISILFALIFLGTMDQNLGEYPYIDLLLRWTYIMLGVSISAMVLLPILGMIQDPKSAVRSLVGVGIVGVIVAICYAFSDATPVITPAKEFSNSLELRLSDTALYATYVALAIAVVSIFAGEIYKLFKK